MPTPGDSRAQAVPLAWRVEPRRATRCQERKLQEWRLDCRGDRGAQMAAVSRAVVCQDGDNRMTNKTNNSLTPVAQEAGDLPARTNKTPVAHQPGRPPVRLKLRRINANFAKAYRLESSRVRPTPPGSHEALGRCTAISPARSPCLVKAQNERARKPRSTNPLPSALMSRRKSWKAGSAASWRSTINPMTISALFDKSRSIPHCPLQTRSAPVDATNCRCQSASTLAPIAG
jgi:hypothetical protein